MAVAAQAGPRIEITKHKFSRPTLTVPAGTPERPFADWSRLLRERFGVLVYGLAHPGQPFARCGPTDARPLSDRRNYDLSIFDTHIYCVIRLCPDLR